MSRIKRHWPAIALSVLAGALLVSLALYSPFIRAIKDGLTGQGERQYARLAFGPEARTEVLLALDGTDLYVDRNGDGSFTADECFPQEGKGCVPFAVSDYTVKSININRSAADGRVSLVAGVQVAGRFHQYCDLNPVEQRGKAPVAHFDGPLRMGLRETNWVCKERLERGDEPRELYAWVGTFDRARGCWVVLSNDRPNFPTGLHPAAEVVFPARVPGQQPVRRKYELPGRC